MVFNANDDQWALNFSDVGGKSVALDLVIADAFLLASLTLWDMAKRRDMRDYLRRQGLG